MTAQDQPHLVGMSSRQTTARAVVSNLQVKGRGGTEIRGKLKMLVVHEVGERELQIPAEPHSFHLCSLLKFCRY